MGLRKLVLFRCSLALAIVICVLIPAAKSQIQGCSVQGIDLGLCLNQSKSSAVDTKCCELLNKAVKIGYNCLCLLQSSLPVLSTPLLLPLSNCFISVPPLSLCKVLAPMPIVLPPSSPIGLVAGQPSPPPKQIILSPAPLSHAMQPMLNSTGDHDDMAMAARPSSSENAVPKFCLFKKENETSNGSDETKILRQSVILSLTLHFSFVLAGNPVCL